MKDDSVGLSMSIMNNIQGGSVGISLYRLNNMQLDGDRLSLWAEQYRTVIIVRTNPYPYPNPHWP